jgi:hypothetical protein
MLQNPLYLPFVKLAATANPGQVKTLLKLGSLIFLIVISTACGGGTSTPTDTATPAGSNPGKGVTLELDGTSTPTAAPTPEPALQLNSAFILRVGQTAVLEDEPIKIIFDSILQDIRCPSKVQCAEAGFARIQVGVQVADQEPASYEMNTEPFYKAEMGLGVNKITHADYEIQLTALTPTPEYPDDKLDFGTYEATFVVTKNAEG